MIVCSYFTILSDKKFHKRFVNAVIKLNIPGSSHLMTYFIISCSVPKEDVEEPTQDKEDQDNDSFEIANPEDYREIFRPKSRLSHSPTRPVEPFQPPPDDGMFPAKQVSSPRSFNRQISSERKGSTERKSTTPLRKGHISKSVSDDGRAHVMYISYAACWLAGEVSWRCRNISISVPFHIISFPQLALKINGFS